MKNIAGAVAGLFIVLMMIVGCHKEQPAVYTGNYFPLNIGDSWNFKGRKEEVKGLKTINNKVYVEVRSDSYRADTVFYSYKNYYRTTPEGEVYQYNAEANIEFLLFNFTVPVNHSWTSPSGNENWQITNATETKVVNIGHTKLTNCREFDYDIPEAVDDEHGILLAPGIGKIINFSFAWGLADTLRSAHINGVDYCFE